MNFEVLQQFLVYNEFCQKVEDQETLELIQGSSHNSSNAADADVETTQEHASTHDTAVMEVQLTTGERLSIIYPICYFFFPGLVKAKKPLDIWLDSNCYTSGWCLECIERHFFTIQFLHVLLLRNTFGFAAAKRQVGNCLERKCVIWKNGVFWGTPHGVEALVEVVEQNTVVIVLVRCLDGHEMEAVKLRSAVIKEVHETKAKHCPYLKVNEYLINPSSLAKFRESQVNMSQVDKICITELAASISSGAPCVQDVISRPLHINKTILHFEPYAGIGKSPELLASLFDPDKAEEQVPQKVLSEFANLTHEAGAQPNQIAHIMSIPSRETAQSRRAEPDDPSMQLFRLFMYGVGKYKSLHELFDLYSIFRGRNPLVSYNTPMYGHAWCAIYTF